MFDIDTMEVTLDVREFKTFSECVDCVKEWYEKGYAIKMGELILRPHKEDMLSDWYCW